MLLVLGPALLLAALGWEGGAVPAVYTDDLPPALWFRRDGEMVTLTLATTPSASSSATMGAVNGSVQRMASPRPLPLPLRPSSGGGLAARLPSALGAPFMLEAARPGVAVANGVLTMLWANADAATTPNDWFGLQSLALNDLEITLRDAYMHDPGADGAQTGLLAPGDPYPSAPGRCAKTEGAGWKNASMDACVIAVLNLRRSLPFKPDGSCCATATLSTFDSQGRHVSTFSSDAGVYILRFPHALNNTLMHVSATLAEGVEGAVGGVPYRTVLHRATATARLVRTWSPAL